jgi:hypothetical protein
MIEVRIPAPAESKLEMLNKYAGEGFELINRGHFVYLQLPKYRLAGFKKFIATNGIAKAEQIEEVLSVDFPINPPEKNPLLVRFLESINADFTVSAFIKLPKRDFEALIDFLSKNGFEER